jgi:hypothetical protein
MEQKMSKEIVMLVVDLISNKSELVDYMSEMGDVWGTSGEKGFDEQEIWCEEFMSGNYKWVKEENDGVKIEFYYDEEEILCFKLWVGNLFVEGII